MRIAARVLMIMLVFAALPATAEAHATLLTSSPEAESVVARAPTQVVLSYDQPVQPVAGQNQVVNSRGVSVTSGAAATDPANTRNLVIPLKAGLPDGDYTVRWRIVSTDGHVIAGVLAFGVGKGRPAPQAVSTESSPIDWSYLTARFAYFTGLLLVIGGLVFRLVVSAPVLDRLDPKRRQMAELREGHRANQLFTLAVVLMLGGGWIALTLQGSEVAGVSFWEAFDHRGPVGSALEATRFGREFGRGIDITAAFAVIAAIAIVARRHSRVGGLVLLPVAVFLGGWAVAVPGLSGHAGDPGNTLLTLILDALHVAAAAVWIGGLAQLVWVTPHATRGLTGQEQRDARTTIVTRFSWLALGSVVVLAVTGGVRALWSVDAVSEIWSTSYGRMLVVKTVLFVILIWLGYRNRNELGRFSQIHRRGMIELGLMAALIVAVTVLTNLPPANTPAYSAAAAPPPAGGPKTVSLEGGGRLSIWPGTAGVNMVSVRSAGAAKPVTVSVRSADGSNASTRLSTFGDTQAGVLATVGPGQAIVTVRSGSHVATTTLAIGPASTAPVNPPAPNRAGAVAAEEAGDLAVGLQREGSHRAQATLIASSGEGVPRALVLVDGHGSEPCAGKVGCYTVAVPAAAATLAVKVIRPGGRTVTATLQLPAASAKAVPQVVTQAARAYRALKSVQSENILASSPTARVVSTFVSQAPDRVATHVHGGQNQIVIGNTEWIQQADGTWQKQSLGPGGGTRVPDPFWAPNATAVHDAGTSGGLDVVTLVRPGTRADAAPVFFRLWIDPATHLVHHLRMITAAHFMSETEHRFNAAPAVVAPR